MARKTPLLQRRAKARRVPKRRVVVFCEGRNTEPVYLKAFNREVGRGLVEIHPVRGVGVPKTVVAHACDELLRIRRSRDSFERNDEVWAAFDRDEHEDIDWCLSKCRSAGVGVAFSNPCIEQWAIIHFQDPVSDAPLTPHQAQNTLSQLMPKYDKGGAKIFDFELMRDRYELARSNAETLVKRREEEGNATAAPVTTFYLLTDRLIQLGAGK